MTPTPAAPPLIGISLGWDEAQPAGTDTYRIRRDFFGAVSRAGGLPLGVPHDATLVEHVADGLAGLVIPSGDVAFPAVFYAPGHASPHAPDNARLPVERALVEAFLDRDKPVLGICHGMQLLAALLGGTLQGAVDAPPVHRRAGKPVGEQPTHPVTVDCTGPLSDFAVPGPFPVVSNHLEAVVDPGGATVLGRSEDGVIEAVASPRHRFAVGVQWHAELSAGPSDRSPLIFAAFVKACREGTGGE